LVNLEIKELSDFGNNRYQLQRSVPDCLVTKAKISRLKVTNLAGSKCVMIRVLRVTVME
jgi:hypothetical protein